MSQVVDFVSRYPEVGAVLAYLGAIALHVAVGVLLHLFRLHDFDWHKLGAFVEQDLATRRGIAIGTTFVLALVTTVAPGADVRAAFVPAFAALAAAAAAGTLPILRDAAYELVQLFSGWVPPPQAVSAPVIVASVVPLMHDSQTVAAKPPVSKRRVHRVSTPKPPQTTPTPVP